MEGRLPLPQPDLPKSIPKGGRYMNQNPLHVSRHAFCCWYLALGNVREAAVRAGCPPDTAETEGMHMLRSPACKRLLAKLAASQPLPLRSLVTAGLARLAFGPVNDAVRLAFSESLTDDTLAQLDLFHVTSIKHDKNGIEIKLADRLSAMQQLLACAEGSESTDAAAALLAALSGTEGVNDLADSSGSAVFSQAENGSEMVEES